MFKIQERHGRFHWDDLLFAPRFNNEEQAWEHCRQYDQDGQIDRANFRVVKAK